MKVAVFSTNPYDRTFFLAANRQAGHELVFFEPRLTSQTCPLASGFPEESDLFFEGLSNRLIQDDVFSRMLTFPNVIITGHQAFFTQNALEAIALETLGNITAFEQGQPPPGLVKVELVTASA
jgi:lactate dehydrogenase-like 2-hydroxyacid dehydrogenase